MSTELGTLERTGSRNVPLSITRYYGGKKKGVCVQFTALEEKGEYGYVQLSASDLLTLIPILQKEIVDYSGEKEPNKRFIKEE